MLTPQTNTTLVELAGLIRSAQTFAICGHVSPDGDCIGSQLALYHALTVLGKKATCLLVKPDSVGDDLLFLPGVTEMVPAEDFSDTVDIFISCDVPTIERMGDAGAVHARAHTTVTIDHHMMDTVMSQYNYIDPAAASTTLIIWDLIKALDLSPDLNMALCAYTGLVTDTGGFRYQNSDAQAFAAAGEMVATGIDPSAVAREVFQCRRRASLELEALVLERMVVSDEGYVISYITLDDFTNTKGEKSDADPLIDVLRSLKGIRVACILREQEGSVRGSLRAKDDTDVAAIARHYDGGGHKAAAGFTVYAPLMKALDQVCDSLGKALAKARVDADRIKTTSSGTPDTDNIDKGL